MIFAAVVVGPLTKSLRGSLCRRYENPHGLTTVIATAATTKEKESTDM